MSAAPTGKGRSVTDRPYINPAEIELIAILLNRQNQLRDCEMLGRDDFQEARHYDAFTTIKDLHAAGESIDPLAVATAMDPKDKAEYSYLNAIAKEHGYFTGNLWARAVSMRKDAINRACQMAAANSDWTRIVELRAEYDRLGQRRFNTFTAAQLLAKEFPPLRWLVDGVLPEGCTLLAAPPKVGKSRLALQMALALANGGYALNSETTQCQAIEVLYLALESGERRLQKDIRQLQPDGTIPVGLHLATTWRRLAEGGIGHLDTFLEREPGVKLVIIDTLAQARSATHGDNGFLYSSDYLTGAAIKELGDRHGISILIVHHTRKAISDIRWIACPAPMALPDRSIPSWCWSASGWRAMEPYRSSAVTTPITVGRSVSRMDSGRYAVRQAKPAPMAGTAKATATSAAPSWTSCAFSPCDQSSWQEC